MLKVERSSVMNMENAIRGARNPMNSWARMDSTYDENGNFILGENDLSLARRLAVAGSDHRYRRTGGAELYCASAPCPSSR